MTTDEDRRQQFNLKAIPRSVDVYVRLLKSNDISLESFHYNVLISMIQTAEDNLDEMMGLMPLKLQDSLRVYSAEFLDHHQIEMLADVFVAGRDDAELAAVGEIVRKKLTAFNHRFHVPAQ